MAGEIVMTARIKKDEAAKGLADLRGDIKSAGEAQADAMSRQATEAERAAKSTKASHDVAVAGAIAAAKAERDLEGAIARVIAGTA